MINPYAILIAVSVFLASVAGAYIYGRIDGKELAEAAAAREQAVAEKAASEATKAAVEAIGKIRSETRIVQGRVEREIQTRTVYADCAHDERMLGDINQAITGRPNAGPNTGVPASSATK